MGSEENVGDGEKESEDRNYSPTAVVSPSCATVKHQRDGGRERRKVGEVTNLTKDGLQSPAALEEKSGGQERVSG